eukprot:gb/GECH01005101.1/.p1 GENE.gb/GECH01005101.1/~~gb/GECH01005101.1/.p1  ORF type:complete len:677 (+),score=163.72 gb/GECH01005101.1/:1-2031(+)
MFAVRNSNPRFYSQTSFQSLKLTSQRTSFSFLRSQPQTWRQRSYIHNSPRITNRNHNNHNFYNNFIPLQNNHFPKHNSALSSFLPHQNLPLRYAHSSAYSSLNTTMETTNSNANSNPKTTSTSTERQSSPPDSSDSSELGSSEPRTTPQEAGLVPTLEDSQTEDAIRDIIRHVSHEAERTWFSQKGMFSRPDVVSFRAIDELPEDHTFDKNVLREDILDKMVYFHIPRGNVEWAVVRLAFIRAGIKRVRGEDWNVLWGRHLEIGKYRQLNAFQRVNHFPGTTHIGRKDRLAILLEHMAEYGSDEEFAFHPSTYVLPDDRKQLQHYVKKELESGRDPLLIKKPPAASCGRRIKVFRGSSSLPYNEDCIVQEYISNPLLVNNFKFDLRLYVVVTSYNPLRVYLYPDGLTRFATEPYSNSSVHNRTMHLTNYSINKKSPLFVQNTDESADNIGSKWSVNALKAYFQEAEIDDKNLWDKINDIIIKTLISGERIVSDRAERFLPHRNTCFELYGFDIMIDADIKPWLVEVNLLPSLACESPMDKRVKAGAVTDLLNLVGVVQYDRRYYMDEAEKLGYRKQYDKTLLEGDSLDIAERLERALHRSLTSDDLLILEESEFEEMRKGDFNLIFPRPDNAEYYRTFFTGGASHRNQRLLCEWKKLERQYSKDQLHRFLETASRD